jgi:hypothetical protein
MNRTQLWAKVRKKLKKEFEERGIISCEMCSSTFNLSFAHRDKRRRYYSRIEGKEEEELGKFENVLLLCCGGNGKEGCHQKIEKSRELTLEVFNKLRISGG